jgi:hypothetical protein
VLGSRTNDWKSNARSRRLTRSKPAVKPQVGFRKGMRGPYARDGWDVFAVCDL